MAGRGASHLLKASAYFSVLVWFDLPLEFDIDHGHRLEALPSWVPLIFFLPWVFPFTVFWGFSSTAHLLNAGVFSLVTFCSSDTVFELVCSSDPSLSWAATFQLPIGFSMRLTASILNSECHTQNSLAFSSNLFLFLCSHPGGRCHLLSS